MIDLATKFGRKVKQHLRQEYVIWLTTLGSDLSPQPRPVWFIWDSNSFLIFSRPASSASCTFAPINMKPYWSWNAPMWRKPDRRWTPCCWCV
jgi:hypothetical protein